MHDRTELPVVVLVEGPSDVAALSVLLAAAGVDPDSPDPDGTGRPVQIVDLGGVTNTRRELARYGAPGMARQVLGLCDEREAGFVVRALADRQVTVAGPDDLARHGFHICRDDLEDELIRALGVDTVVAILDDLGLARRFESFRRQEHWRDRQLADQLHRFAGIASGRKIRLARALAQALPRDAVPAPLAALISQIGGHDPTLRYPDPQP